MCESQILKSQILKSSNPQILKSSIPCFILGLGNVLMGDDGFGPYVARAFDAQFELGADTEVIDLGTPGLDLMPWLADASHVIVIDTIRASEPPGTLRIYDKADIVRHAPFARVSPHDPGVKETLLTLEFAGRAPETVTLIGVVPARVAMGTTLTDPVARAVPAALTAITDRLRRLDIQVRRRETVNPGDFSPWWTGDTIPAAGRAFTCEP
jgi:hydrogenase maturation protease